MIIKIKDKKGRKKICLRFDMKNKIYDIKLLKYIWNKNYFVLKDLGNNYNMYLILEVCFLKF